MKNDITPDKRTVTARLVLDGQPLEGLVGFEYAKDDEEYLVGRMIFTVINANRPRAGARYRALWLQVETSHDVWDTVFAANDIIIFTESGTYSISDAVFEVECKWTNNVN